MFNENTLKMAGLVCTVVGAVCTGIGGMKTNQRVAEETAKKCIEELAKNGNLSNLITK